MIELRHITKTYGKKHNQFTALSDINLTIPEGASVWANPARVNPP